MQRLVNWSAELTYTTSFIYLITPGFTDGRSQAIRRGVKMRPGVQARAIDLNMMTAILTDGSGLFQHSGCDGTKSPICGCFILQLEDFYIVPRPLPHDTLRCRSVDQSCFRDIVLFAPNMVISCSSFCLFPVTHRTLLPLFDLCFPMFSTVL